MARGFQTSFYFWALRLPDSEHVRMLRARAAELFAEIGGVFIERYIRKHEAIADGEETSPRDQMRALGAIDRAYTRLDTLRERAWRQARMDIFQDTGVSIPLPVTPEDAERGVVAEEARIIRDVSAQHRALRELSNELVASNAFRKIPTPAQIDESERTGQPIVHEYAEGAPDEPPTNKQIKHGIDRLIAARVDRKTVLRLREDARAGKLTRAVWNRELHALLTAKP